AVAECFESALAHIGLVVASNADFSSEYRRPALAGYGDNRDGSWSSNTIGRMIRRPRVVFLWAALALFGLALAVLIQSQFFWAACGYDLRLAGAVPGMRQGDATLSL
ncbi:MAG: hypothetical protein ACHRHE_22490, partial [Tepidisphaerales bacterium]